MKSLFQWKKVVFLAVLISLSLLRSTSSQAAPVFGTNYPNGPDINVLYAANWPASQVMAQKDADHMASLSVGVVRILIQAPRAGLVPSTSGTSLVTSPIYSEVATNLPKLISIFQQRGIKVIVAFSNPYLYSYFPKNHQTIYGTTTQGFQSFKDVSSIWMNGLIKSVALSGAGSNVLYYDYENEIRFDVPKTGEYLNYLYDHVSTMPAGKRGVSVFIATNDSTPLKNSLGARTLNFVDFHNLPFPTFTQNPDVAIAYQTLKDKFPNTTVVLGGFGKGAESDPQEPAQATYNLDIMTAAVNKGIPYYLVWGLSGASGLNMAYSPDRPKDVLGRVSTRLNKVPNPDMESTESTGLNKPVKPLGWFAQNSVPFTSAHTLVSNSGQADSATGDRYARVKVDNQSTGVVGMGRNTNVNVTGMRNLYLNFYFRTNMTGVHPVIYEFAPDSTGKLVVIKTTNGPSVNVTGWSWNSYLHRAGSFKVILQPTTKEVNVKFVANATATNPDYLDIDTVSVFAK